MANNVVIDFISQVDGINKANTALDNLGKTDKKNADQFRKSNNEYQQAAIKRKTILDGELRDLAKLEDLKKKAFNPSDIASYNAAISLSQQRIALLKGETEKTVSSLNGLNSTLKNVAASIGIAFGTAQIISFAKEAVNLAAKGEGIRTAFAKIGDEKSLEKLRVATRGASADIDLMAAALRAANFGISTDLLAKGMELAGKVARTTGQDVTFLTNSFVDGLGRKSVRILDNLQISTVELQAEVKKLGGDFNTAVGNITQRKLEALGEVVETTADKIARLDAKMKNLGETSGVVLIGMLDKFEKLAKGDFSIGKFLNADIISAARKTQAENIQKQVESFRQQSAQDRALILKQAVADLKALSDVGSDLTQKGRADLIRTTRLVRALSAEVLKKPASSIPETDNSGDGGRKKADEELERQKKLDMDVFNAHQKAQQDLAREAEEWLRANEKAMQEHAKALILLAENGSVEELEARKDALKQQLEFTLDNSTLSADQRIIIEQEYYDSVLKLEEDFNSKQQKIARDNADKAAAINKIKLDAIKKQEEKAAEEAKERAKREQDAALDVMNTVASFANDIQRLQVEQSRMATDEEISFVDEQADKEMDTLQQLRENNLINEQQFEEQSGNIKETARKKQAKLKQEQWKREQDAAVTATVINTAVSVIKTFATLGYPAGIPAAIAAGIVGGTEIALIKAQPVPKFKKGTKSLEGGQGGVDDVLIYANRGEAIIPTEKTQKFKPVIDALFDEHTNPTILNQMAELAGRPQMNGFAENMVKSLKLQADLNPYDFKRAMKGSDSNIVKELREIKKELKSSYTPSYFK